MKCKWHECDNEVVSTGNRVKEFCSSSCRMKFNRSKANTQSEQIQSEHENPVQSEQTEELTKSLLATLPAGVVHPTGQPNEDTACMTGQELNSYLAGNLITDWQATPEYAEVIYRLLTDDLEGLKIPAWKKCG